MILIFVFNSCFFGQSLVEHGLNRKNEEKVICAPRSGSHRHFETPAQKRKRKERAKHKQRRRHQYQRSYRASNASNY